MHVSVDEGKCCGAGQCALIAPGVFDQREEDGTVLLLNLMPAGHLHAAVREAAGRCPSGAIQLGESA